MIEFTKKYWVLLLSLFLGIVLAVIFFNTNEWVYLLLSFLSLSPVAIYLFLYEFKWLYYLLVLNIPLSIHLDNIGLGIGISLPGELLLILVFIGVVWRVIFRYELYKPIFHHPISLIVAAHLVWLFLSLFNSVLVEVSIKFLFIRIIYVFVFYVYGARLFLEKGRLQRFLLMYILGLLPIILFTWNNHMKEGFSIVSSNRMCYPFFNDHTIYAACIAMILPLLFSLFYGGKRKIGYSVLVIVLLSAMYFSFSRAGWLSLVFGMFIFLPLFFKLKLKWFLTIFAFATVIGGAYLIINISKLKSQKTNVKNVEELAESMTDTETNYSNIERLNRWESAYKMFKERPVFGFGPGTFMFVYGRYQEGNTYVSVSDASMGGAHSEYLKPLSEQGFLGLLLFLVLIITVFIKGYQLSFKITGRERYLLIACVVGLTTYYIHGVFNFFLDTDKASVLFWGFIGFVVAMDSKQKNNIKFPIK